MMNKRSFFLGITVLVLWLMVANWYYSYYIVEENTDGISVESKHPQKTVPVKKKKKAPVNPPSKEETSPVENNDIILNYRVTIFKNRGSVFLSNEDENNIVKHLTSNLEEKLVATVFSAPTEKDSVPIKRAENLKNRFIARDIDKRRLEAIFVKDSSLFAQGFRFDQGIKLMYRRMSNKKIREIEKSIEHANVYVYYISDSIVATKKAVKYFDLLKVYLTKYPDKNIYIIGHTDSIGKTEENRWRGLRRAKIAAQYLTERKEIPKEKIITMSKGEEEPLVSNGTEEGRKINRRVEVIIK